MSLDSASKIISINKTLESYRHEITARDLELSPQLTLDLSYEDDRRESLTSASTSLGKWAELSLEKTFSTGTKLDLTANHNIDTLSSLPNTQHTAFWSLGIQQSLWRNALGTSTRLRQNADLAELRSKESLLNFEKQKFLVLIEKYYWDYALLLKEQNVTQSNLKRSLEIQKWVMGRIQKSAAEPTDLLQAQAQVKSRELSLLQIKNQIQSIQNKIKQIFTDPASVNWQPQPDLLESERNIPYFIPNYKKNDNEVIRWDTLAERFATEQKKNESLKISDSLRPKLEIYAEYGQNGIQNKFSTAWDRSLAEDKKYGQVGILFTTELDFQLKKSRRIAAQLDFEAQQTDFRQALEDSKYSWTDLQNQISLIKERIKVARELSSIQSKKSIEERKRYERGRTTAFQALTFEDAAAESEISVYRLLAEARKLESQIRLFTIEGEI